MLHFISADQPSQDVMLDMYNLLGATNNGDIHQNCNWVA